MRINRFEIENFKGIQSLSLHVAGDAPGNVITLIGLNESGKTTILEALSNFATEDKETASLVDTVHARSVQQDFIPKDRKAAFTGQIKIQAFCELEDSDVESLKEYFDRKHSLQLGKLDRTFEVTRSYIFEESRYEKTETRWRVSFPLKSRRAKEFKPHGAQQATRELWSSGLDHIRTLLPKMVYFPTFLFKFPDRIYLEGGAESEVNPYYRKVLQDVLDSQGEGLSVERHIVERVKRLREAHTNPATFYAHLMGLDEKSQIDAVLQKMSNEMSREIFGSWNQILGRDVSGKRVQVDWALDSERNNEPYVQVSIIDGQSRYSLSERSLGFRWFFSFLLFTRFRKNRREGSPTIFLFDEPASNLHSKAQMKLLESFARIANGDTFIIYSTHSHYMVNPEWLEKSFIIDNKAIDYDDEDSVDAFATRRTEIDAVKYRTFVGANPTKTTYFQPVLDALDVAMSPLLHHSRALIIEGKYDFHAIEYFRRTANGSAPSQIYPGNGAGGLTSLVSLFRGWGVDFKVLLDDDSAGQKEKKRYLDEGVLLPNEVATLGDISSSWTGTAFEGLYGDDVVSAVQTKFGVDAPKKRHFSLFFQELLATGSSMNLPVTQKSVARVLAWSEDHLRGSQPSSHTSTRPQPKQKPKPKPKRGA